MVWSNGKRIAGGRQQSMTTEELAELFLASLYDMAEAAPHPYFLFTMNEFAPRMGITDMAELRRALRLLEDKGLVYLASTDAWGGVSAGITMEGSVYVEKGGETGIIGHFRTDPSSIGIVPQSAPSPLPSQITPPEPGPPEMLSQPPTSGASEGMLDAVLSEMATAIQNETTLDASARKDLLADIGTLQIQLSKETRNQAIIMAILDNLSGVPSLLPLARLVLRFLTPHSP
jgi:hypothetical protein